MKGKLEQLTKSKSGKAWRVMIDGRWFGAKFDSKIDSIPIGGRVDFLYDTDPKYGDWITTWGPDTSPPPTQAPVAPPRQSSGHNEPKDRYWLPFVSNQVAHAIAAGRIQEPGQMLPWAKAAYTAVTNLEGPEF